VAGQRVAVGFEGAVEFDPVLGPQVFTRGRQHGAVLQRHVLEVVLDIARQRLLERFAARLAHHLVGQHAVLEFADRGLAHVVVGVELVEHGAEFGAARAHLREQQLRLLRVVQALGEFVDVEQHRAQHVEGWRLLVVARLAQQHVERAQHRRDGLVLVLDHLQGMGSHGITSGYGDAIVSPQGTRCLEVHQTAGEASRRATASRAAM
jgi:hypothetical protein